MINISFDNPYLLLLLIPMVLLVVIPFCIAIRRENKSKETTIALICHLLIVTSVILAVAGMTNTAVMTKTEVYVLADVSASTSAKTDIIDGYIKELREKLPQNSKMGVITFGKDSRLLTPLGEKFSTVKDSGIDASATDILSALKYADSLFSENTIKRIVLYSDGFSTDPEAKGDLIRVIENMSTRGIYVDVVYIDSNIPDDMTEFQISDVEFNSSTYLNRDNTVNILVESTADAGVIVRLSKNGDAYLEKAVDITRGYNIVNFNLDTAKDGDFDYEVSISALNDTSDKNNTYAFTQRVNKEVNILLVTNNISDKETVERLYGGAANITACVRPTPSSSSMAKPKPFDVPYTVEELCKYDQYIISNVTVEDINNADSFVESLDICVSQFGKSLITAGDNGLHNSEATSVESLKNMIPVKFGNNDQDPKLYAIVIDSSRSMEFTRAEVFLMAKTAAKHLINMLNENDYFMIVNFSGEAYVPVTPCEANEQNIAEAELIIDGLEATQGTMIGKALDRVNESLTAYSSSFEEKQVMLISDGMSFEGGSSLDDDPSSAAAALLQNNIFVSTINPGNPEGVEAMQKIAAFGGGKSYYALTREELEGVIFEDVANDVTDTVVTGRTEVIIDSPRDSVLDGIETIPAIEGYVYARAKASAENILYVNYKRSGGSTVKAPLYSYWSYGNGRVATLTTDLGGEWTQSWGDGEGLTFLQNIQDTNIPLTRIDSPYTVGVSFDGKYIHVEVTPAVINPDATTTVKVTMPDGNEVEQKLTFDSYRYFYDFEMSAVGKYTVATSYQWGTVPYNSSTAFNISYSPEYDKFNVYSPAPLHTVVRNNGTVTEDGNTELLTDPTRLDTYIFRFTVPLLVFAVVLYIIDTVIRKLKWADIKSFFKRRGKGKKEAVK